jgi:membrane-associated protein
VGSTGSLGAPDARRPAPLRARRTAHRLPRERRTGGLLPRGLGVVIPFLTGDSLLFAAGIIAGTAADHISIWVLAIGVGVAAFASDQVGFWYGRRFGKPVLEKRGGAWVRRAVAKTERFYELFGWWAVVIGRYIPWGRVFVPPIAGISRMTYATFATANLVGAFAWGVSITVIGYFAASNPQVRVASYVIAGIVILISLVAGIRAWRIDRAGRVATEPLTESI